MTELWDNPLLFRHIICFVDDKWQIRNATDVYWFLASLDFCEIGRNPRCLLKIENFFRGISEHPIWWIRWIRSWWFRCLFLLNRSGPYVLRIGECNLMDSHSISHKPCRYCFWGLLRVSKMSASYSVASCIFLQCGQHPIRSERWISGGSWMWLKCSVTIYNGGDVIYPPTG